MRHGRAAVAPTFREEDTDHEAEHDDADGVEEQEDEGHRPLTVDHDGAEAERHVKEERHDGDDDEHEGEVLEEPGQPAHPDVHAHHLHRLLRRCEGKQT